MFTIHHLRFHTEVVTPLELDEHSGSALRGSFFEAIWKRFCTNKDAPTCAVCPLHATCPVSAIVAPLREENARGQDIPRPYILLPPMKARGRYKPGDALSFGLTLFGHIIELLPYILLSVNALEEGGLGKRVQDHHGLRGRFKVKRVESCNLFSDERHTIYEDGRPLVKVPALAMTEADVQARAANLPTDRLTINFLTPLRLNDEAHMVKSARFKPFIHRLLERFQAIDTAYGTGENPYVACQQQLVERAGQIQCVMDATYWNEAWSYSRRLKRATPLSGLLGRATFVGDLASFRELLVWGEAIHVGKSCMKW